MTRRTLKGVKIVDVQKRKVPSKHYVYVISVTWSDESVNIIYRRYSKFFDLQTKLLEEFPEEGGVKDPSKRLLPFLPGKILFGRSHVRDVAIKRKEPISEYCTKLIALLPKISESDLVLRFFEPHPEDIDLPLEKKKKKKETADVISEPVTLDQFIAIADYQKQNRNEITMVAGDVVEVIDKNENGWWFVNLDEEQGWVPAAYLEPEDGQMEESLFMDMTTAEGNMGQYITTTAHKAELDDEISFEVGVIVAVVQKNFDGWWLIRYQNKEGWAPAMYLKKPDPSQLHAAEIGGGLPKKALVGVASAPATVRFQETKPTGTIGTKSRRIPPRKASVKRSIRKPISITNVAYDKSIQRIAEPQLKSPEAEYFTVGDFRSMGIQLGLDFDKGESVEVLDKNPNGWWYGKIAGHEGWIPSSYLGKREKSNKDKPVSGTSPKPVRSQAPELKKPYSDSTKQNQTSSPKPPRPQLPESKNDLSKTSKPNPEPTGHVDFKNDLKAALSSGKTSLATPSSCVSQRSSEEVYIATADFQDNSEGVISLKEGDDVSVLDKNEGGWWLVRLDEREGWAPSSYLSKKEQRDVQLSKVKPSLGKAKEAKSSPPLRPKLLASHTQPKKPPKPAKPARPDIPVPTPRSTSKPDAGKIANASSSKPPKPIGKLNTAMFESKFPIPTPRSENRVNQNTAGQTSSHKPTKVISGSNSKETETLCIATVSYTHDGEDGISFNEGEEFEFLEDSHSGWWLVKTKSGQENWAPASYLELKTSSRTMNLKNIKPEKPKRPEPPAKPAKQVYVAIAPYHDDDDDAVSFNEGDEMEVLEQDDSGWWLVQVGSASGWAPSNYLKPAS